jgi:excisionase family DNA binding protein
MMATLTYYTLGETAELLKVHPQTVRRWIREKRLRAQRFGKQYRLRPEDIQRAAGNPAAVRSAKLASEADGLEEFERLSLAGLHDLWDNDEDSIYDSWKELYGVQQG